MFWTWLKNSKKKLQILCYKYVWWRHHNIRLLWWHYLILCYKKVWWRHYNIGLWWWRHPNIGLLHNLPILCYKLVWWRHHNIGLWWWRLHKIGLSRKDGHYALKFWDADVIIITEGRTLCFEILERPVQRIYLQYSEMKPSSSHGLVALCRCLRLCNEAHSCWLGVQYSL